MAQSQQPPGGGEAEFVRQIVTDPRNVPDVMRLYGYAGASSEDNHDRLYLNPDLSSYVEVPQSAILHRMTVPTEQDPNGAVVLWVRRDAALIQKAAPAAQALAQYFAGAIAGAAVAAPGVAAVRFTFPPYNCPSPVPAQCTLACPTVPPAHCVHGPTVEFVCTPACYSILRACVHLTPQTCNQDCWVVGGAAPEAGAAAAWAIHLPPTRIGPACPYPTEICTHVGPACHPSYVPCTVACPFAAAAAPGAVGAAAAGAALVTPGPHCTHNIACVKSPVCTLAEPACQSVHHRVCSAICAVPGAPAAAGAPAAPQVPAISYGFGLCSYGPGCWYTWGACPTLYGCPPPMQSRVVCSAAPGCW
jgi:hypothetical protein